MIKDTLANKRIFVVEDDPSDLLTITNALIFYGASVHFIPWGTGDMVKELVECAPDVILLDLMFPKGVTGYSVLAGIRAHFALRNIPVIAVSALDFAAEIPKVKEAGFAGFIAKPISLERLPIQLTDVLTGHPVWVS